MGKPVSKIIYPINSNTNGEIINFSIEIDAVNLLITLSVWKDNIIPIAKSPTDGIKVVEDIVKSFPKLYKNSWLEMMKNKLGIFEELEIWGWLLYKD